MSISGYFQPFLTKFLIYYLLCKHCVTYKFLVPGGGIEPPLPFKNWILSPARLPIPPSRLAKARIIHETTLFINYNARLL